jgi:hypothetical protein
MSHRMKPEASAEFLRSLVSLPISDQVDSDTQRTLQRLRSVFCYGLFEYELFTAAQDLAFLAIEGALGRRFMLAYNGRVPFVKPGQREEIEAGNFDVVHRSLRRDGRFSPSAGWRLAGIRAADHKGFDCSYTALI